MLETNKMNKKANVGELLKEIFKEKWDEKFIFDGGVQNHYHTKNFLA